MSGYEALKDEAEQAIASATDLQSLDAVRIQFLGKTGKISEVMKGLGKLSPEERKEVGQALNQIKQHVSSLIDGTNQSRFVCINVTVFNSSMTGENVLRQSVIKGLQRQRPTRGF